MVDKYLQDLGMLEGQPKRVIADYVESNGILVPRRFSSFSEAVSSGVPVIARSEHTLEYLGMSGLLESPSLNDARIQSERELRDKVLSVPDSGRSPHREYCELTGVNEEDFEKGVSFSYWHKLSGTNRTIVADSSIRGRYHITAYEEKETDDWIANYTIVDNGKITEYGLHDLTVKLRGTLYSLIEMYEKVRNLSNFDVNNCPIVEAQTLDGKDYFLQYHRTRDFNPSTFVLERQAQEGEIEVPFVRGATLKEGMECDVTVSYAGMNRNSNNKLVIQETEDGSMDYHTWCVFSEIMVSKRKLQVIQKEDLQLGFMQAAEGHLLRSKLIKPEVSLIMTKDLLIDEEAHSLFIKARETGEDQKIKVHIVSDGRRALIKRI